MSRHLRDGNGVVADGGRLENSRVLSRRTVGSIKLHSSVCVLSIHASYRPIFCHYRAVRLVVPFLRTKMANPE